jgi:hypothetical protein
LKNNAVSPYRSNLRHGGWGIKQQDGTFNGMVGMLNRKKVDVGVGAFMITIQRTEAAKFLNPFTTAN